MEKDSWAYIKLHQWFTKTTLQGQTNNRLRIMQPMPPKHDHEVASAVERWEEKYRMLLEEMIKKTEVDHVDYDDLQKALGIIKDVAMAVNDGVRSSAEADAEALRRELAKMQSDYTTQSDGVSGEKASVPPQAMDPAWMFAQLSPQVVQMARARTSAPDPGVTPPRPAVTPRPVAPAHPKAVATKLAGELRAELLGMSLMRLQKRAIEAEVELTALEAVVDGDAPKADLVALLLALDAPRQDEGADNEPGAAVSETVEARVAAQISDSPTERVVERSELFDQWEGKKTDFARGSEAIEAKLEATTTDDEPEEPEADSSDPASPPQEEEDADENDDEDGGGPQPRANAMRNPMDDGCSGNDDDSDDAAEDAAIAEEEAAIAPEEAELLREQRADDAEPEMVDIDGTDEGSDDPVVGSGDMGK